jgi:hypothetical protein
MNHPGSRDWIGGVGLPIPRTASGCLVVPSSYWLSSRHTHLGLGK